MSTLETTASMPAGYLSEEACALEDFHCLVKDVLDPASLTFADTVENNVPLYDVQALSKVLTDPAKRLELMAEWGRVLSDGAGVLLLRRAYRDTTPIDAATQIFEQIIATEKVANGGSGDHFAKAGANDRIWNALQKLCLVDPGVFARYFGNTGIDAVCEAWLGPGYQMTAQVNLVRPGGAAQEAHRDYHLGFQTAKAAAAFPRHQHLLTAALTLQGAIAHCDMPVESGPTKLLPFSQRYDAGYVAFRRPEFRAYFEEHCIQLPLRKGDAVFFSPALFHAAGANTSADVQRMANLLQVSSAFGRAMESVDREMMTRRLYPALRALLANGDVSAAEAEAAIAACAEGYSFPTNLDNDPPIGGLAPVTPADLFRQALSDDMSVNDFNDALAAQSARRIGRTHGPDA